MVRLLTEKAALAGGAPVFAENSFDGRWFFGDQVLNIRGRGTDLIVGVARWHFKQLASNTAELFILDSQGDVLHVVTGHLDAQLQTLTWSNGRVWTRVREAERRESGSQGAAEETRRRESRTDDYDRLVEEVRLLRRENQRLRESRGE
jgi:ribosomal protein L19E